MEHAFNEDTVYLLWWVWGCEGGCDEHYFGVSDVLNEEPQFSVCTTALLCRSHQQEKSSIPKITNHCDDAHRTTKLSVSLKNQ
jgi:hypothetical protein